MRETRGRWSRWGKCTLTGNILYSFVFLQLEKEELRGAERKTLELTVLRFESRVLERVLEFREFHRGHSAKSTVV